MTAVRRERRYPPGVTSWIDVECGDVEAAKAFYSGIFGWAFADATPPAATWSTYVAVDDAQAAASRSASPQSAWIRPASSSDCGRPVAGQVRN